MAFKLAHLSDIHFFHFCKSPLQFFSKRFIGNLNSYFTRRPIHNPHLAYQVIDSLKKLGVSHLLITGDYTTTGSKKELGYLKNYLEFLKTQGFTVYTIPGNHDVYTKTCGQKKKFYSQVGSLARLQGDTEHCLSNERVASFPLFDRCRLVLADCSYATPFYKSTGIFSEEVEKSLTGLLSELPSDAVIILAVHYPYDSYKFPTAHLERGNRLGKIIENDPRIRLYLHGHRHTAEIMTKKGHMVIDSGSISLLEGSSFNLLTISTDRLEAQLYKKGEEEHWDPFDGKEISMV